MIDPTTETLLAPKQIARLFPGRSGREYDAKNQAWRAAGPTPRELARATLAKHKARRNINE
jgi:hypothetical protein